MEKCDFEPYVYQLAIKGARCVVLDTEKGLTYLKILLCINKFQKYCQEKKF